jgi:AraC family transcriptional regulator
LRNLSLTRILEAAPAVDFAPASIAMREFAGWSGLQVETLHITRRQPFEHRFHGRRHLLFAAERATRDHGETYVEGLPASRLREFSGTLTFVPAGHRFHEWHDPRALTRLVYVYIDPKNPFVPFGSRLSEIEFKPKLFFRDQDIWETVLKLRRLIETPSLAFYGEALQAVLAQELLRMNSATLAAKQAKGGLASWQQKRVAAYIEDHLAEDITIGDLAKIVDLSPFHFARAFKTSFGVSPHQYHLRTRIGHAKRLLAVQGASVTETGLRTGFGETSSFTRAFKNIALQSPSEYRRSCSADGCSPLPSLSGHLPE